MHRPLQGCRLTGKPSASKIEVLSSTLSVLANFSEGGARWRATGLENQTEHQLISDFGLRVAGGELAVRCWNFKSAFRNPKSAIVFARVAQLAEAADLRSVEWEFKSSHAHHHQRFFSANALITALGSSSTSFCSRFSSIPAILPRIKRALFA